MTYRNNTTTYLYDQMGRVRDEYIYGSDYDLETTYEYDLMGNISEKWYSGLNSNQTDTTTYSYDLNNRLLSESTDTYYYQTDKTHSYSSVRYYYDNNGNMTAKQGTNTANGGMSLSGRATDMGMSIYRYDAFNRLIKYYSGSAEASYTYNANNLRASKTVNRERTDFVWNGQNLVAENKADSVNTYTYDITRVHIANKDENITSYLKDYHGNIVGTTTVAGVMVQEENNRMDYDAFGNQWIGDTPDPFGYCGEYYDIETDSVYLRARYYRPTTGRFITEDPIRDGFNWYVYCMNNPIFFIDPSGNYYIKKNSRGRYILEPDTYWSVFGRSIAVTFSAALVSEIEYSAFNIVGGNSAVYGDAFEEGSLMQLQEQFPELAILFKVKDVYDGLQMVFEGDRIVQTDNIAFGLLSHAGISTSNGNKRTLEKIMNGTYAFIHSNSYFVDGLSAVFDNQTLHRIDYNLSQAKDPQKIIDKYKQKAYSYFISIGYNADQAQGKANSVESMLNKYDERRQIMFDEYDDFIWSYINN